MVAGRLRLRVTFQQAVIIRDPDGMLIQGWQDRFTLWCHVRFPKRITRRDQPLVPFGYPLEEVGLRIRSVGFDLGTRALGTVKALEVDSAVVLLIFEALDAQLTHPLDDLVLDRVHSVLVGWWHVSLSALGPRRVRRRSRAMAGTSSGGNTEADG